VYIMFARKVWRTSSPAASICRDGEISFNKALTQMFLGNGYEWVLLLVDREKEKIAVRSSLGLLQELPEGAWLGRLEIPAQRVLELAEIAGGIRYPRLEEKV
jgi:hypothetical protein